MSNQKTTVMGPGGTDSPVSTLSPPTFNEQSDRLAWREGVNDWSENVIARADGGDNKAKGIAACLGLTLYRSLPIGTKEQVKQSIRSGEIILTPGDESGSKGQLTIIKKILDIIAKDTAVDRIARMVRLNTQVHQCVRKTGETIKEFIGRFKVPSFAYLNIVRAGYNSSESQIFAMTLIINAKLGEQLFANVISTLINATKCMSGDKEQHISVRKSRMEIIVKAHEDKSDGSEEEIKECIGVMKAAIEAHDKMDDEQEIGQGFISLASALEALESISLEQKSLGNMGTKLLNEPAATAVLMGGPGKGYEGRDRNGGGSNHGGYNRPYNTGFNRSRYHNNRTWRGREDWNHDRTDLRKEIDKKRHDRDGNAESKNDEKYRKRAKFGEEKTEGGQSFR